MKCIKCNREMTKFVYNDIIMDQCPHCGGIWLDKYEFYTLIQQINKKHINKNIECFQKSFPNKKQTNDIVVEKYMENFFEKYSSGKNVNKMCPRCGESLTNVNICNNTIDICQSCYGMFFDKLEFEQIYLQIHHQQSFYHKLILKIKSFLNMSKNKLYTYSYFIKRLVESRI